jgi:hypothetical protein
VSDELKHWQIMDAVDQRGPREPSPRAVLRKLARHCDSEGTTFVGIVRICESTCLAKATVLRALACLERQGWIRIEERAVRVETPRGFERKGNLYRLSLVKLGLAVEKKQWRDEGYGPAPALPAGDEGRDDEGGLPVARKPVGWNREADEGVYPGDAKQKTVPTAPVQTSSARSLWRGGEVSLEARRGVIGGAPLMKKKEQEKPEEEHPPYAPPGRGATVERKRGESPEQPGRPAQLQRLANEYPGSGQLLAFPKRQRPTREPRRAPYDSVRQTLDGEEAALWDEATRVMQACGVSPESSGRKVRRAVMEALRLECERPGGAITAAGELAVRRWDEYRRMGHLLLSPRGVMGFFASGEWLNPSLWRLTLQGQEIARRGRW